MNVVFVEVLSNLLEADAESSVLGRFSVTQHMLGKGVTPFFRANAESSEHDSAYAWKRCDTLFSSKC